MHQINFQTKSRDGAMTMTSNLHSQGFDVAVWSDVDDTYFVLDGTPQVDVVEPSGPLMLEFEPAKGIPIVTEDYRGPDRRATPRERIRVPVKVMVDEQVGHA